MLYSLGLLYSAFTYTDLKLILVNISLWVLYLIEPIYEKKVKQLMDLKEDGTFRLEQTF